MRCKYPALFAAWASCIVRTACTAIFEDSVDVVINSNVIAAAIAGKHKFCEGVGSKLPLRLRMDDDSDAEGVFL